MNYDLFDSPSVGFAATRQQALVQLDAFIPFAGRYGRDRNQVTDGHPSVSKLSPAIRHRLILESECAAAPLQRYAFSTVEKFTQEIYWRSYWKSWLSLRPQVWTDYLDQLETLHNDSSAEAIRMRAKRCEAGESPIAIMNYFARELTETGYLHNHARMWFAGWWIHIERLPWQLGADFFFRHLLDADPASNTLSWRWVAGLQTPGKTYLPRLSNLEKYLSPDILKKHHKGLEHLEQPQALILPTEERPRITRPSLSSAQSVPKEKIGIWIHEEDLFIEQSPLATLHPCTVLTTADMNSWTRFHYSELKIDWLRTALNDAAQRASDAFKMEVHESAEAPLMDSLLRWATDHQLQQVATMRPEVGPLHDQLENLQAVLLKNDIQLILFDRPEDLALRPYATAGFFGFWEKIQTSLKNQAKHS